MTEESSIDDDLWTTSLINSTTLLTSPYEIPTSELFHQDSSSAEILRYVQLASIILVIVFGFISNTLVVLLFYKRPMLRSFSNRFVLNLSLSHLFQCILVLPTTAVSIVTEKWLLGEIVCIGSGFIFTSLNITSVLSLLLIALDRNCAVNSPLHYSMTITKKRTGILIFGTWLLGVLIALPSLFTTTKILYRDTWHMCTLKWNSNDIDSIIYGSVLIVVGFMLPFLTTICVYSSMFQAARDNSERARKHSVESAIPEVRSGTSAPKKKFRRTSSSSNQLFGEEWKAVRTGVLVVMTFTLCWLPYFSVVSIEAYFDADNNLPDVVMFFVVLCASIACVINPYLYVFRNKTSRKNVKQLICPSNLMQNKKWMFHRENKDKTGTNTVMPCALAASLVNESSEKVKALPAAYQDVGSQWQSREEIEETVSNTSDDDFFNCDVSVPTGKRKPNQSINVQAIYNNSYSRNMRTLPSSSGTNKLLLYRLKSSLTRDSTSSDTTENYSISLESNNSTNSNEHSTEADASLPSRRGIGKYLFNTSEELWESRPSHHKRSSSVTGESTTEPRKHLSSLGSARRKSFIYSHMRNKKSSETTLTSSTPSSDASSSSKSSKSNRPKLVRQLDTTVPPEDDEHL
ncbi:5-hydroxytryptamine receptor 1A-like [Uloborus diversus]|uniref:5-hydroxytryptamine receptor 1A-like n=1 Tax=Uloborus diversus TaxID=327109 RepID=UPI00240A54C8|nr:5-hydroxytryptamine receptor 1A-like [Uloborus diversus]